MHSENCQNSPELFHDLHDEDDKFYQNNFHENISDTSSESETDSENESKKKSIKTILKKDPQKSKERKKVVIDESQNNHCVLPYVSLRRYLKNSIVSLFD
jgi:hypothetical protein